MTHSDNKYSSHKVLLASSQAARNRMRATRRTNTKPELAIQSILQEQGLSFKVDQLIISKLRRRADILFENERVAVFVDGCFWHGCPIHGTQAKENAEFWRSKIKRNQERDAETTKLLKEAGWKVIRIWELEDPTKASRRICNAIKKLLSHKASRTP